MNSKEFINRYGSEELKATSNFATKSLGVNYDVKDAFIEFCDNAYDGRIGNSNLEIRIDTDDINHMISIIDNGTGIKDDKSLFLLGGTNKERGKKTIGKYGIGVPGATAAIATQCKYDNNEMVDVIYESACNGKHFIKHTAFMPNGEMINGKTKYDDCDVNNHFTKLVFTNVKINNVSEIMDEMEETYELTLKKDMSIVFNDRNLGKSKIPTFVGDETPVEIKVGNMNVNVMYRISSSKSDDERSVKECGLRIYDKNSGRLLAKSMNYWKWFCGTTAYQDICGLRCGVFIDGSLESYAKFGVMSAKNGITYRMYSNDPDFLNLKNELKRIYTIAHQTNTDNRVRDIDVKTIGTRIFRITNMKFKEFFIEGENNEYLVKKKYSQDAIIELINENINLKKSLNRRTKKSKSAEI